MSQNQQMTNQNQNLNEETGQEVITMDTDYIPKKSDIPLKQSKVKTTKYILVKVSDEDTKENNDSYVAMMTDTEQTRKEVEAMGLKIVGSGETTMSIPELLYALQHPTRMCYQSAINDLKLYADLHFNHDDGNLRSLFNNIK